MSMSSDLDDLFAAAERDDAAGVARAFDSLIDHDALDDRQWLDSFALVDERIGTDAFRRVDGQLGRAIRRWLSKRSAASGGASWKTPLAGLAVEIWRRSADFTPQYLCDFAGAMLRADPDDDEALDAFLEGSLAGGEAYLHRGIDLEEAARQLPDGRRKAVLLGLHAVILEHASSTGAGEALARALRIDPGLDGDDLRARCARAVGLA